MPNVKNVFLLAVVGCALLGCAKPVQKEWFAHDGSKADGTVKMAMTWNPNTEKPQSQQEQAQRVATEKCRAWGYESAEAFGSVVSRCTQQTYTGFGVTCIEMLAEMNFQCLGGATHPQAVGKTISK